MESWAVVNERRVGRAWKPCKGSLLVIHNSFTYVSCHVWPRSSLALLYWVVSCFLAEPHVARIKTVKRFDPRDFPTTITGYINTTPFLKNRFSVLIPMCRFRSLSWPPDIDQQLRWTVVWASLSVVCVILRENRRAKTAWNNSVQHRWTQPTEASDGSVHASRHGTRTSH